MQGRVIRIHAAAPEKPAVSSPCNGCGACCAAEPCPLSALVLGHRKGACPALVWDDLARRYYCAMVRSPARFVRWLPGWLEPLAIRLNLRWIASGHGCDFAAEIEPD